MTASSLERSFDTYWRQLAQASAPAYVEQLTWHVSRDWRWDIAWPDYQLALELQGGSWTSGRHNRGAGMAGDYEKHLNATRVGWRVLYLTTDMLHDDPSTLIAIISDILRKPVERDPMCWWMHTIRALERDGYAQADGVVVTYARRNLFVVYDGGREEVCAAETLTLARVSAYQMTMRALGLLAVAS